MVPPTFVSLTRLHQDAHRHRLRGGRRCGPLLFSLLTACEETPATVLPICAADANSSATYPPLPLRAPPAAVTTGTVPHRQIDPEVNLPLIAELERRAFAPNPGAGRTEHHCDGRNSDLDSSGGRHRATRV